MYIYESTRVQFALNEYSMGCSSDLLELFNLPRWVPQVARQSGKVSSMCTGLSIKDSRPMNEGETCFLSLNKRSSLFTTSIVIQEGRTTSFNIIQSFQMLNTQLLKPNNINKQSFFLYLKANHLYLCVYEQCMCMNNTSIFKTNISSSN